MVTYLLSEFCYVSRSRLPHIPSTPGYSHPDCAADSVYVIWIRISFLLERQCDHVCGNIKLNTKNSEKGKREKGKKKGFIMGDYFSRAFMHWNLEKNTDIVFPTAEWHPWATGHFTFEFLMHM